VICLERRKEEERLMRSSLGKAGPHSKLRHATSQDDDNHLAAMSASALNISKDNNSLLKEGQPQ
jgi:hypothetical protein